MDGYEFRVNQLQVEVDKLNIDLQLEKDPEKANAIQERILLLKQAQKGAVRQWLKIWVALGVAGLILMIIVFGMFS